jgi:hypothetical protein
MERLYIYIYSPKPKKLSQINHLRVGENDKDESWNFDPSNRGTILHCYLIKKDYILE